MYVHKVSVFSRLLDRVTPEVIGKTFNWQERECTTEARICTTTVNTCVDGWYAVVCFLCKWADACLPSRILHMTLAAKAGLLALMPLPTEANQALQMHEILSSGK